MGGWAVGWVGVMKYLQSLRPGGGGAIVGVRDVGPRRETIIYFLG